MQIGSIATWPHQTTEISSRQVGLLELTMLPGIDTEVDPSPKKLAPTPSETTQTTRIAELCHQSYICNNVYRVQLWNASKGRNTLQHNRQPQ